MKNSTAIIIIIIGAITWGIVRWMFLPDTFVMNLLSTLLFIGFGISLGVIGKKMADKNRT